MSAEKQATTEDVKPVGVDADVGVDVDVEDHAADELQALVPPLPPPKVLTRSVSMASGRDLLVANGYVTSSEHGSGGGDDETATDTGMEGAMMVASPQSASSDASNDSAPSISAIERALEDAPGVTTRRETDADTDAEADTEVDTDSVSVLEPRSPPASAPTPSRSVSVSIAPSALPESSSKATGKSAPRSSPILERSRTEGELLSLRQKELMASGIIGGSSTAPSFEIESVTLPADRVTTVELDKTHHTMFAMEVRLRGGLQWIIKKRYSDFRELHDRLKRTNSTVKQLSFPKRHVFRNRHQGVIELRRSELERYINNVLEIRPLIRVPLFNFLEVYAHMESFERKIQRHKKELESERMKNLLPGDLLEDLSTAFARLCSSKFVYHPPASAGTTTSKAPVSSTGTAGAGPGAKTTPVTAPVASPSATSTHEVAIPSSPSSTTTATSPTSIAAPSVVPATSSGDETNPSAAMGPGVGNGLPPRTVGSQVCLSRASFRRDVLGVFPEMPSSFAMRFMKAVSDRQGTDINMDEFLRAVAILRCGTKEDRLHFVFHMCDLDHAGKVQSTGLSNFLVALHGRQVLDLTEYRRLLSDAFDQGRARLSVSDFVHVLAEMEATTPLLLDWMEEFVDILCETPDPHLLESQEEFNPAVQQKILASETHFNGKEVGLLQDAFHNYHNGNSGNGHGHSGVDVESEASESSSSGGNSTSGVDLEAMSSDFPLEMTDERFHRVFASFGPRANGEDIDVFSFVHALAIACRGTPVEKATFALTLFSSASNSDGALMTRDDMYGMLRQDLAQNPHLQRMVTRFTERQSTLAKAQGLRHGSSTSSVTRSSLHCAEIRTPSVSGSDLGRFVDALMREHGHSRSVINGSTGVTESMTLTSDEFLAWTVRDGYEMAALRIMREVVFIDLGLVPVTKEEELLVARGCYQDFDAETADENDSWFLIERKWFMHWSKYVKLPLAGGVSPSVVKSTNSSSIITELPKRVAASASSHTGSTSVISSSATSFSSGVMPTSTSSSSKEPPIVDAEGNYLRPKCINNYVLLTGDRRDRVLKTSEEIKLGKHFAIISEQLWMGLKLWYGGGPELQRKVVIRRSDGEPVVDIWGEVAKQNLELEKAEKDAENGDDDEGDVSDDTDATGVSTGGGADRNSVSSKRVQGALTLPRRMRTGGSVGLTNLGNTCYMNSALQCLSSTQLLAEYFLSGMYLDDVNRTSTLGMQGKLAEVYGKLAEDMWCAKQKALSPRNFKKNIGKFNEAFRGNDQQDAQELLSFLLSGLSEDLNRIQEKPYVEQPDSDGRFDADLADEWWGNHLRREVSIIVALFTGQYKSLLTCSECGFKSARFEPFTFLQLPLPEPTHNTITMLFVLSNGMPPTRVSVRLNISATVMDLKRELVLLCHSDFDLPTVSEQDIKICEFSGSMILSFKADNRRIGQIRSIERLIAFQLEPMDPEILQATRTRRPSYIPPTVAALRAEEMEADRLDRAQFFDNLTVGTLVEVRARAHSHDYVHGVVVACPERKGEYEAEEPAESIVEGDDEGARSDTEYDDDVDDEEDESDGIEEDVLPTRRQLVFTVRLQRGVDEEVNVPASRLRPRQARLLYIPLLSRKLSYSALYLKNPFRPGPFGLPNLLRICPERTSGLDLYRIVWQRMKRYLTNRHVEPTLWDMSANADSLGEVPDDELCSSRIDPVFTGRTSSCGFVLRRVENKGLTDSRTGWLTRSFGHTIPCTLAPLDIREEETIAIDWDLEIFQDRINLEKMKLVEDHSSVEKNEAIDKGPVPLQNCLDAFTNEEKISEGYCSGCRKHLEMTKKLEIWRLPPVMVIQLKRFQYTQTYRRKLGSLVEFPVHDMDLSRCVAPHVEVPERYPVKGSRSSSVTRKVSVDATMNGTVKKPDADNKKVLSIKDMAREKHVVVHDDKGSEDRDFAAESLNGDAAESTDKEDDVAPEHLLDPKSQTPRLSQTVTRMRRGYTNTNLDTSRCLETNYDLYGVVNHQGALGGGHYTAYAQNFLDEQWYYYDDERVRVVEESKIVSPSAYLLFYLRSDMKDVQVKDLFPQNSNTKITDEEIDRFVEDEDRRCTIM